MDTSSISALRVIEVLRLESNVDLLTVGLVSRLDMGNVADGGRPGGPLKGATCLHSTRPVYFMSLARLKWNMHQRGNRHLKDGDWSANDYLL